MKVDRIIKNALQAFEIVIFVAAPAHLALARQRGVPVRRGLKCFALFTLNLMYVCM